jgi:hypothetical protein
MVAQLAEIQWPAGSRRHARPSRNEAASNRLASATGVRREADSRDRPPIGVLVEETPATVAREAAIPVRIVVEVEGEPEAEAETVSGTAAFPVAEDPAAPVDSAAAPEATAAVVHGAAVRAAHQAWEAPVEAVAGGGGES